jgi:hypothetical protein
MKRGMFLAQETPATLLFLFLIGCLAVILSASLPLGRVADLHRETGHIFTLTSR